MNALNLFVPCAAGVEAYLACEVAHITQLPASQVQTLRGGVQLQASWREALLLNLHSRLGMRVLIQLVRAAYVSEQDIYNAAAAVATRAVESALDRDVRFIHRRLNQLLIDP